MCGITRPVNRFKRLTECPICDVGVNRLFLHIFYVIAACAPLVLLVADMVQRYPLDEALMNIGLVDAALLIAATILPVFILPRLGVDWRSEPEEY